MLTFLVLLESPGSSFDTPDDLAPVFGLPSLLVLLGLNVCFLTRALKPVNHFSSMAHVTGALRDLGKAPPGMRDVWVTMFQWLSCVSSYQPFIISSVSLVTLSTHVDGSSMWRLPGFCKKHKWSFKPVG